jgi:hypothetical protein
MPLKYACFIQPKIAPPPRPPHTFLIRPARRRRRRPPPRAAAAASALSGSHFWSGVGAGVHCTQCALASHSLSARFPLALVGGRLRAVGRAGVQSAGSVSPGMLCGSAGPAWTSEHFSWIGHVTLLFKIVMVEYTPNFVIQYFIVMIFLAFISILGVRKYFRQQDDRWKDKCARRGSLCILLGLTPGIIGGLAMAVWNKGSAVS